jgi:hypothetical protein
VVEYQSQGLSRVEWEDSDTLPPATESVQEVDLTAQEPQSGTIGKREPEGIAQEKDKSPGVKEKSSVSEDDVQYGPAAIANGKRGRGRPKGSKDKRQRKRRKIQKEEKAKEEEDALHAFLTQLQGEEAEMYAHLAMEEGEELLEAEVFLCWDTKPGDFERPSKAFNQENPFRPKWVEAKSLEQVRLEAYKTWRRFNSEEEQQWRDGKIQAVPCALLLNRKRCGRFKARLVVLGNRWKPNSEDNAVFASVVSQTGNRAALIQTAKNGFEPVPFDITNAFIRASMGSIKVAIRLPESFREGDDDCGKRMLLQALYGLPISPRLWAKTLAKDLADIGWVECKHEPGVWTKSEGGKVIGIMTVYVDDCMMACCSKERARAELKLMAGKHPLTEIKTEVSADGTIRFDLLGADVELNPKKRTLRMHMKNYCEKFLKKFDMQDCKPRAHPSFPEENLYCKDSGPSTFPYKACVGALQWLSTVARPDLSHSTNMLARASANPVTNAMAKACRLVMRYVAGTKEVGLEYSPESEREFHEKFSKLAEHADNEKVKLEQARAPVHTFTDASFGVTYREMRSISGVVIYMHGTPVAWKSKVQSVFASSTTESEWVAMADGIAIGEGVQVLKEFLVGSEKPLEKGPLWCDNRSAVICGRKGPANTDEIPKRTRHVALRFAKVLTEFERLWFCPTMDQRADGLTKSGNPFALRHIFVNHPKPRPSDDEDDDDEEEDHIPAYMVFAGLRA